MKKKRTLQIFLDESEDYDSRDRSCPIYALGMVLVMPEADIYLGLYDDVNDLLDHCVIDKKTLRDIIPSNETRICSID
ncbi:MAG: hypothetical protein II721_08245 [Bacilli bacterium]|nr:hypothetical protein [Bacilli bacterium]